jgi:hypothetical protein
MGAGSDGGFAAFGVSGGCGHSAFTFIKATLEAEPSRGRCALEETFSREAAKITMESMAKNPCLHVLASSRFSHILAITAGDR